MTRPSCAYDLFRETSDQANGNFDSETDAPMHESGHGARSDHANHAWYCEDDSSTTCAGTFNPTGAAPT